MAETQTPPPVKEARAPKPPTAEELGDLAVAELQDDRDERQENHEKTERRADKERERRAEEEERVARVEAERVAAADEREQELIEEGEIRERDQSMSLTGPVAGVPK